jgi:hypothetical protein
MMNGHEKSDSVIVAEKLANKAAHSAVVQSAGEPAVAEPLERRAETKGNADQQSIGHLPRSELCQQRTRAVGGRSVRLTSIEVRVNCRPTGKSDP